MLTHDAGLRERLAMYNRNKLKIGIFGTNVSSGLSMRTVPERWMMTWDENLAVARIADECGIDFLLPVGRWKGYGGTIDFEGTTFETITWASGMLAATKRITVFGTVHAPMFHPVIAAKQMVTDDHIGEGRFGLNFLAPWNEGEFETFGLEQRDHAERYAFGDEWIRAIKLMWERDDFDFDGDYFHFKGVRLKPKPYGGSRPIVINAGRSADGRSFAIRNCDAYFLGVRTVEFDEATGRMSAEFDEAASEVGKVRQEAAALGREIGVYTRSEIVCRPTQREAFDAFRYWADDNVDQDAVEYELAVSVGMQRGTPEFERARIGRRRRFPVVGDPDYVAGFIAKIAGAGFDALGISFLNYLDELPYFRDEVLPRLERLGLREPFTG